MVSDPKTWSGDFATLAAGDEFTWEWLDRFRALMAAYNEAKGALQEIVRGDVGATFSGSQCVEIAQAALAKLERSSPC